MQHSNTDEHCPVKSSRERQPEGLTFYGYRNWFTCYFTQNDDHAAPCRNQFASVLGKYDGPLVASALGELVRNLCHCATCRLNCYAPVSGHLNEQECMLLGVTASIQHGDVEAMHESVGLFSSTHSCIRSFGNPQQSTKISDRTIH